MFKYQICVSHVLHCTKHMWRMRVYLEFSVIIGQRFGALHADAKTYCKMTRHIVTLIVQFVDYILKMLCF